MRLLVLAAALFAGCAAPAPASHSPEPPREAAAEATGLPDICGDVPHRPLASTRQNYSLASEYYRSASSPFDNLDPLGTYCAATVYLRWLTEHAPLFNGGDPDDRTFLRLANAYRFFADEAPEHQRVYLDSALAIRARGLALLRREGLPVDEAQRALARGHLYFAYPDAFDGAAAREADAYFEAIRAAPDSVDDWYLQRLVTLTAETIPEPLARADSLERLVPLADHSGVREYVSGLVVYLREPTPAAPPTDDALRPYLDAFARGEYDDCEPPDDVWTLVAVASQTPEFLEASGGQPKAIIDALLDCVVSIDNTDPQQLFALFARSWGRDDYEQAETYYRRALAASGSDRERARLVTARAARGWGDARTLYTEAVRLDPLNARARYALVRLDGDRIGVARGVHERAVYWCLIDRLDDIVALGDADISPLARRSRDAYRRAAPSRAEWFFLHLRPGETIRAASGRYTCTTRVR